MIRSSTSSPTSILSSASSSASTAPDTSPLRTRLRVSTLPCCERLREVLEADALATLGQEGGTLGRLALLGDLTRGAVVRGHDERVAGARAPRSGRAPAPDATDRPRGPARRARRTSRGRGRRPYRRRSRRRRRSVPDWTSTVATAPRPLSRFASMATPRASLSGLARRSSAASAVSRTASSSWSMPCVLLRGDVDEHRVAAVLLGHQVVLGELLADLVGVGPLLVHLVDRDHDRHVGRLGVVERLDGLRHHAVVGRDHEDRDVGDLRTTGTHGGERLVARGVDERDRHARCPRARCAPGRHRCAG